MPRRKSIVRRRVHRFKSGVTLTSQSLRIGNIEIRLNDDRTVDEVVVYRDGECVFHLEQLASNEWWADVRDDKGNSVHLDWFTKTRAHIKLNVSDQTVGGEAANRENFTCDNGKVRAKGLK